MHGSNKINVAKLLRVLVAGGLALAGVAGATRAEETAAPSEKTEKEKEHEQERAKAEQEKKKAAEEKRKAEAKRRAEAEAGGVRGW